MELPVAAIALGLTATGLKVYRKEGIIDFLRHPLDLLAGHLLAGSFEAALERFKKGLECNSPPENDDLELAVTRSAILADLFCLRDALPTGMATIGPFSQLHERFTSLLMGGTVLGVVSQGEESIIRGAIASCEKRLEALEKGKFHPVGIDPVQLAFPADCRDFGRGLGRNALVVIESGCQAMPPAVVKVFEDYWFKYLCLGFHEQIKTNDRARRIFVVLQAATGFLTVEEAVREEGKSTRTQSREQHGELIRRLGEIEARLGVYDVATSSIAGGPTLPYVVGREEEIRLVDEFVKGDSASILNVYGTGGIGKTTLCEKLTSWCKHAAVPWTMVDLDKLSMGMTVTGILSRLREGLDTNNNIRGTGKAFQDFDRCTFEHSQIRAAVDRHGGLNKIFDANGDPLFRPLADKAFDHQDDLTAYFGRAAAILTSAFVQGITAVVGGRHHAAKQHMVLFFDGYEKLDFQLERWLWKDFIADLPANAKTIILGRRNIRAAAKWVDGNPTFTAHELKELNELEAGAYLKHYGATNAKTLDRIYQVTRGFPLLLVLARQLKDERGSWEAVLPDFGLGDVSRLASKLLERLLEEPGVKDVREFLERGVVAEWFDAPSIRDILNVPLRRAVGIYENIGRFSFVRAHPYGLQFHETVRELLSDRFKHLYGESEYAKLVERWSKYLGSISSV